MIEASSINESDQFFAAHPMPNDSGNRKKQQHRFTSRRPRQPPLARPRDSRSLQQSAIADGKQSRGLTNLFITFHAIAIILWTLPFDNLVFKTSRELIRPYMTWSGLFQSWDTFAPNPIAQNQDLKAMVIDQNQHPHIWSFPRMEELGFWERYKKERYRKFEEVIVQPSSAAAWPDVARHVARLAGNPSDPLEKVLLLHYTTDIVPWDEETGQNKRHSNIFFDDYVETGARQ